MPQTSIVIRNALQEFIKVKQPQSDDYNHNSSSIVMKPQVAGMDVKSGVSEVLEQHKKLV